MNDKKPNSQESDAARETRLDVSCSESLPENLVIPISPEMLAEVQRISRTAMDASLTAEAGNESVVADGIQPATEAGLDSLVDPRQSAELTLTMRSILRAHLETPSE